LEISLRIGLPPTFAGQLNRSIKSLRQISAWLDYRTLEVSAERAAVLAAGCEIAEDGMEVRL